MHIANSCSQYKTRHFTYVNINLKKSVWDRRFENDSTTTAYSKKTKATRRKQHRQHDFLQSPEVEPGATNGLAAFPVILMAPIVQS